MVPCLVLFYISVNLLDKWTRQGREANELAWLTDKGHTFLSASACVLHFLFNPAKLFLMFWPLLFSVFSNCWRGNRDSGGGSVWCPPITRLDRCYTLAANWKSSSLLFLHCPFIPAKIVTDIFGVPPGTYHHLDSLCASKTELCCCQEMFIICFRCYQVRRHETLSRGL